MLFGILVIVLIGVIAYFHYLQGLFSAALSAIFAVIAALLALGYHEVLVTALLGGKFADLAYGIALAAIFAVVYIVLRLVADKLVSGNVRYPLWVDRIGAAAMGVVAGVAAVGVLAVAAQTLPFGPSIAMYERYPVAWEKPIQVKVQGKYQMQDAVFSELDAEKFLNNEPNRLMFAADELVLGVLSQVTADGRALSTGRPFSSVHPDYLQEMFGQRLGLQVGSKHCAIQDISVDGVFTVPTLPQDDPERWEKDEGAVGVRHQKDRPEIQDLPRTHKPAEGNLLLVVRVRIGAINADEGTSMISFGPAAARMAVNGRNHFPIGTLEGTKILMRAAPDDYLFVPGGKGVDLVYEIPESEILAPRTEKTAPMKLADGTLFEFKRLARAELGGRDVTTNLEDKTALVEVVRKEGINPKGGAAISKATNTTLAFQGQPTASSRFIGNVNIGMPERNARGETKWGTVEVQDRKFTKLDMQPVETIQAMEMGPFENKVSEFQVPQGMKMVQFAVRPAGSDKWAWADDLGSYELVDNGGKRHKPHGAFAKVANDSGQIMAVAGYDMTKPLGSVPSTKEMRPTEVTVLFLVPSGVELKSLEYKRELVQLMNFLVQ